MNRRESKFRAVCESELDIRTDQTEHHVAGAQSMERVREPVTRLPTHQQEVVLLRLFEECLEEETASAMGCC